MTKLNDIQLKLRIKADLRNSIVKAAFRHAFQDEFYVLRNAFANLAQEAYQDAFKHIMDKIQAIPEDWLKPCPRISIAVDGAVTQLDFTGHRHYYLPYENDTATWYLRDSEREIRGHFAVPNSMSGCEHIPRINYEPDHPIAKKLQVLVEQEKDLISRMRTSLNSLDAMLRKHTTVKKLIESWPEIEELLVAVLPKTAPEVSLPAKTRQELNTLLDLPIDTKAT